VVATAAMVVKFSAPCQVDGISKHACSVAAARDRSSIAVCYRIGSALSWANRYRRPGWLAR